MHCIACCLAAAMLLAGGNESPDGVPSVRASSVSPREVQRLVTQFRRAKSNTEKQGELIDEAITLGPQAVGAIHQVIGRELQPSLDRYRNQFFARAESLSRQKLQAVDPNEVAALRQRVLALQDQPGFSKEMIQAQGDPAMARLAEIFVLDRESVLQASSDLQEDRAALSERGEVWQRCAAALFDALPDEQKKDRQPPVFDEYLQGEEELAVGLAVPMDGATRAVLAANARLASQIDGEEARCILALNVMRNLLGLRPVAIDLKLCLAARDHSQDMERLKFFSHDSPVPGKTTPWDRARRAGTSASGENIFVGSTDGRVANKAWFHSPGHHKNMLGNHKRVGLGRSGAYFTELFGG